VGTTYLRSKLRGRFWWGLLGWRIWAIYNKRTEFADKSPIVVSRMFRSDLATLHSRLPRLDAMIASQRAHAAYFEQNLRLAPARLPLEDLRTVCNRFMYPVVFPSTGERDAMAAHLRRHGIGTASPYEDTIEGAARHYGYESDCPSAERTLRTTLVIPSSHALTMGDTERIVRCANEGWAVIRESGRAQPMTSLRA
jgi:dTDP-4-amino-4,6-dideoxygalactose transaminase